MTEFNDPPRDVRQVLARHSIWLQQRKAAIPRGISSIGARADLIDADLSGLNLRGVDLRHAELSGANMRGADLRGANLSHVHAAHLVLADADLRGANLRSADLSFAEMSGALASNADFEQADLTEATMRHADLRYATLCNSDLVSANLEKASLVGASLHLSNAMKATFRGANLSCADLRKARLWRTDFRAANLSHADLYQADAQRARFDRADLRQSSYSFAIDLGASVTNVILDSSEVECARAAAVALPDAELTLSDNLELARHREEMTKHPHLSTDYAFSFLPEIARLSQLEKSTSTKLEHEIHVREAVRRWASLAPELTQRLEDINGSIRRTRYDLRAIQQQQKLLHEDPGLRMRAEVMANEHNLGAAHEREQRLNARIAALCSRSPTPMRLATREDRKQELQFLGQRQLGGIQTVLCRSREGEVLVFDALQLPAHLRHSRHGATIQLEEPARLARVERDLSAHARWADGLANSISNEDSQVAPTTTGKPNELTAGFDVEWGDTGHEFEIE